MLDMESREEAMGPAGEVRFIKIEEKIRRLTRSDAEKVTKEILEILDEGEILHPTQGTSIVNKLVGKTDDLYLEPSFATLVEALHSSYEASGLARQEDLTEMVWRQLRFGSPKLAEAKHILIDCDSRAREVTAKLKIFTPLNSYMSTGILGNYIRYCDINKEWNSYFVGLLIFLIREGADPFQPIMPGGKVAFISFVERLCPHGSEVLMSTVSTFLEEAFKKWEHSEENESILNDFIKNIPSEIIEGDFCHLSNIKGIIVANCLKMIETHPPLCDHQDGEGKTPLHRLIERVLVDGLWKGKPELVEGTDKILILIYLLITNKNVNSKDKDTVTPYSWILWWHKSVPELQTSDAHKKLKLARTIEDMMKGFHEKGASEEDALQGMKNLKTTSLYRRIEEKIQNLTKLNIEHETEELIGMIGEREIIYPSHGPSIMEKLLLKIDNLYLEPSFAKLVKTLHPSYEASALARQEEKSLQETALLHLYWKTHNQSEGQQQFDVTTSSNSREVIAKFKILALLVVRLSTRVLCSEIFYHGKSCSHRSWNSDFVAWLTFLIREGADPFCPVWWEGRKKFVTTFSVFLLKLSLLDPLLGLKLMPSVSAFLEETFNKWEFSESKENILNDIIKNLPSNVIDGAGSQLSSLKGLIVAHCLKIIETNPGVCNHEDGEGKTPLHRLMEKILMDGLWKEIPGLIAGTDKLWDLMSGLITNKNVNIKDKGEVTPYTWILWWQKSVSELQVRDAPEKEKFARKIEDIKKDFQEKGASEEDALQGLKKLKTKSFYTRIDEKIEHLNSLNIDQQTKEILEIIEEGDEIIYPKHGPSIMKKLLDKTDHLYGEPAFAKLLKTLYPSYKGSALAMKENFTDMVLGQLEYRSLIRFNAVEDIFVESNQRRTRRAVAKIKIFAPLDADLCSEILFFNIAYHQHIIGKWNSDFVDSLTFLLKEGACPFFRYHPVSSSFALFVEKLTHMSESLMPSVSTFLEEALKKREFSGFDDSTLNDIIKKVPSDIIKGDSTYLSNVKWFIVETGHKIIETIPTVCDHVDEDRKTALHRLMEKLLKDGVWKEMPELVAGTDILWDLMSRMITNKNVNKKDKDKVTPYTWILWWQESLTELEPPERRKLMRKIEDIKKDFQEKGVNKEDALQGLQNLKTKAQCTIA